MVLAVTVWLKNRNGVHAWTATREGSARELGSSTLTGDAHARERRTPGGGALNGCASRGGLKAFPLYLLDTINQCLWRESEGAAGERVLLSPTAFAILRYLVDNAGQPVTHEELLRAGWADIHVQRQERSARRSSSNLRIT